MKNVLTNSKILLPLALLTVSMSASWAQTEMPKAPQTNSTVATAVEVLDEKDTQQFFDQLASELAIDGYKVDFGKQLPKVTIKSPELSVNPMTDEEKAEFFKALQQSLAKDGIEIDFGQNLPAVERLPFNDHLNCDFDHLSLGRFDNDRADEVLLRALLMSHLSSGKGELRISEDLTEELLMLLQEGE